MENTSFSKPIFKRLILLSILMLVVQAALFMLLNQPDPSFAEKKLDRLQADTKQLGRVIGSLIKREDFAAVEQMLAQARNGDVARGIYLYRSAERQDVVVEIVSAVVQRDAARAAAHALPDAQIGAGLGLQHE